MYYRFFGTLILFTGVGLFGYAFLRSDAGATLILSKPSTATSTINVSQTPGRSNLALTDSLTLHWTFDGKDTNWNTRQVSDVSGNGRTGTITNVSTTTGATPGKIGQGMFLDGVGDQIEVADSSTSNGFLDYEIASSWSVSFWIKAPPVVSGSSIDLLNKGGAPGWRIRVDSPPAATYLFQVRDGIGSTNCQITDDAITTLDNTWHHFVSIRDAAASTTSTYMDNILQCNPADTTTGSFNNTSNLIFSGVNDFQGIIDDVRIYDRALSADEVKRLYFMGASFLQNISQTPGRSNLGINSGLVGYWTFDGPDTAWTSATAGTVADRSGQGNTGTLTNMNQSTSPTPGKVGQGFLFDGVNDYINAGNNFSSVIEGANRTLVAWGKTFTATPSSDIRIITLYRANSSSGFAIVQDNPTNNWHGVYRNTGGALASIDSGVAGTVNVWQHIVLVQEGASIKIYVDGAEKASASDAVVPTTVSPPDADIGAFDTTGSDSMNAHFNGVIDDVRIYNRALSADEVKQLYLMGR